MPSVSLATPIIGAVALPFWPSLPSSPLYAISNLFGILSFGAKLVIEVKLIFKSSPNLITYKFVSSTFWNVIVIKASENTFPIFFALNSLLVAFFLIEILFTSLTSSVTSSNFCFIVLKSFSTFFCYLLF